MVRNGTAELGVESSVWVLGIAAMGASSGHPQFKPISESQVRVPAEMFAMSDAQEYPIASPIDFKTELKWDLFSCGRIAPSMIGKDPKIRTFHGKGFNVLFCDGHVALIPRQDYIDPRRTARNWNNDHEPQSDTWWYGYL